MLPLDILCRSGQARAWSLPQNTAGIKAAPPWLQVYPRHYFLPAWASLAARVGDTNSIAQRNDKQGDWRLLMNNYCLPHPLEQRHYNRAVHIYKAHWWAPQHHADLPERIYGAKNMWPSTKQGTEHYRPFALLNQQIPIALVSSPASLLSWTCMYHNWPCLYPGGSCYDLL